MSLSGPSDRILSWRQGVASTPSIDRRSSKNASRSISPRKSVDQKSTLSSSAEKKDGGRVWTGWATNAPSQPTAMNRGSITIDTRSARAAADGGGADGRAASESPGSKSQKDKDENPLLLQGDLIFKLSPCAVSMPHLNSTANQDSM